MLNLEKIKTRRMIGIIAIVCIFAAVCTVEGREAIDDEVLAVYRAYTRTTAVPNPTRIPQLTSAPSVLGFAHPWAGVMSEFDTGVCSRLSGYGWTGWLSWPVSGREIKPGRAYRFGHSAIDILAPIGAPVYAAESGAVIWAGFSTWGYGELVTLGHGGGWETYYAHLTEVFVSCGQSVARGALIGTIGQTGTSGFPHLHFVVRNGDIVYDPLAWMTGAIYMTPTPSPPRNLPAPPPGGNAGL